MAAAIQTAQAAGDPDEGDTYYHHWCSALESFCFQNDLISPAGYNELVDLWTLAIANTPHGVSLSLENARQADPQGPGHHHDQGCDDHHGHDHHHQPASTVHHHDPPAQEPPEGYWKPIHISRLKEA
jgi:hypothetical protein